MDNNTEMEGNQVITVNYMGRTFRITTYNWDDGTPYLLLEVENDGKTYRSHREFRSLVPITQRFLHEVAK